jgi:hypothetical protein
MAWDHLDDNDLSRFDQPFGDDHREVLRRLKRAGVRPTMLLNAWGGPPSRWDTVVIAKDAARGDREVWLDPAAAQVIVPGRTKLGRGGPSDTLLAELLPDGRARLSRALAVDLPAGPTRVQTYLYAPFRRPTLASGEPDPIFQETLAGWTRYARTNFTFAAEALRDFAAAGDAGFDVEVWNLAASAKELFDVERYYDPLPADLGPGGHEAAIGAMLGAVLSLAREPDGAFAGVRVSNGFANRRWTESAATQPAGLDALGRHVVLRPMRFPQESGFDLKRALDARGFPDGERGQGGESWKGAFVPAYEAHFPERPLTALGDEPLFRDLSPLRSLDAAGVAHQRAPGVPEVWVNSISFQVARRRAALGLSPGDVARQKARFLLRTMASYVGKGAARVMIYQHDPGETLIDAGDPAGGEPLRALARFLAPFRPAAASIARPRRVTLDALERCPTRLEFAGAGSSRHPGLRQGDVLAFLPFQVDDDRVVAAIYVMTRNAFQVWGGAGPRRFDMPPARFRLRVGGVEDAASVTIADPLAGDKLPPDSVEVVSRGAGGLVLDVAVTDAPRLITFSTARP